MRVEECAGGMGFAMLKVWIRTVINARGSQRSRPYWSVKRRIASPGPRPRFVRPCFVNTGHGASTTLPRCGRKGGLLRRGQETIDA